ncbi:MAG: 2-amino-4-hydroxy-6-hydroxymethyldihydropteridine diphosphokinase [Gammaproteobacteria bacterium]|nr:2-amino-4-hydroxy-6-hydroxymethyldihydropteridine diphosphokinase [Gammaproteobacteria bacterium]MDH3431005.1 2-amino-4-hydroxy-6-hydroxymethyldihydropteridine diphosphokinase [Gammaproteobacteria bacterium]MDH3433643.1 2-amino-4-hydroxy-6-hydroxymethyldihydropteridine diphosphokinase [Gammaproteobacteria bacterium]
MSGAHPEAIPAYIGLGSNLGEPRQQIENALELLGRIPDSRLVARSSLYTSAPFGPVEQPDFVNAAALVHTTLGAWSLLGHLQKIERVQGRIAGIRWGPRLLDLDLLVYGDHRIDEPSLTVPHTGIAERNFVLLPLREIAPELVIPGLGQIGDIEVNELVPRISRIE